MDFQHVQEFFPTCRLARGTDALASLPEAPRPLLQLGYAAANGAVTTVSDMLRRTHNDAFIVTHRSRIVAEHYFNGMGRHSHHLLNSVTKSFVGMLAGMAVEHGQLDTASPVKRYLPELGTAAWRGTTVRHLLDMTAAARYSEDYSNPRADFWQESAVVGWRPDLRDARTPATLLGYARSLDGQDLEPGAAFNYQTVCTNVLGMILERVMGAPLSTLLESRIWSRLATEHDASIVVDPSRFPYVGAGMSSTARDLVNFGLMMINDGRWNGRQVVPASWITDTIRGSDESRRHFAKGRYGAILANWHYRNQVWVASSSPPVMLGIGIHGQLLYMDQARNLVIVAFSSQPEPLDVLLNLEMLTAIQAIATYL